MTESGRVTSLIHAAGGGGGIHVHAGSANVIGENRATGSFILVDEATIATAGAGIIL